MSFPRRSSALSGQNKTTNATSPDYRDYDAMAEHVLATDNPHATSDANLVVTNVTTNNASTSKHGFLRTLENTGIKYLCDDGTWKQPPDVAGAKGSYKYLVREESGTYKVYDSDGALQDSSSYAQTMIEDEALNGLTDGGYQREVVRVVGNIDVDATINIPSNAVLDGEGAYFELVNAVNNDMFDIVDQKYVILKNIIAHGNSANNTGSVGIWISQTGDISDRMVNVFDNIELTDFKSHCIQFDAGGTYTPPYRFTNIWASTFAGGSGFKVYYNGVTDCIFNNCHFAGTNRDFEFIGVNNLLSNFYLMGKGMTHYGNTNQMNNFFVDHGTGFIPVLLSNADRCQLNNWTIRKVTNSDDGTYSAISVAANGGSNSVKNMFNNITVFSNVAAKFKYALEETNSSQDYNTYNMIYGLDCKTAAVKKLGSNSKADTDTIQGTVA